jgi:hypothetical protein
MGFPVAHLLLHALQPVQAPQQAQLPPQGLFPAFLSRIMLRIRRPIISAITAIRRRLIQFAEIHMIIASHPFKALAAPGEERENLTTLPLEREKLWVSVYCTVSLCASL